MKTKWMMTASALALVMAAPAFATDYSAKPGETSVMENVKSGLTKADDAMRETADDIKAFLVGKDGNEKLTPVLIRRSSTAHGLIGETIVNVKGEKIAKVKDIVLDKNGKAVLVVVSDGGVLGIGDKVAAFNYDKVVAQQPDGKVVMTLSQDMVDHAKDFSYDQKDWAKAKVIPQGSLSVNNLLEGNVLNSKGEKVADIENIHLRGSDASQIIVGFNKTLGVGGDMAAIDYDDVKMVRDEKSLDFQLTAGQSAWFESFKASVAN